MKEQILDCQVSEFSRDGHGLAHYQRENGSPCLIEVPFAIPGDQVRVKLLSKKKKIFTSYLLEILKPSPSRISPTCVHFAHCGGCRWQQQTYDQQLKNKEVNLSSLFESLRTDVDSNFEMRPIVACDPPWNYRNKMEFSFSMNAAQEPFLGLHAARGRVVNLTVCHLVSPWFVETLKSVREWWIESGLLAYHPYRNTGSLRTLTLREGQRSGDRMAILTVSGNPDYALKKEQLESLTSAIRSSIKLPFPESRLSIFLRIQQIAKGSPTQFYEILLEGSETIREILSITPHHQGEKHPLTFHISPQAFFQPNTRQAEKLYSLALQCLEFHSNSVVYDLYCGTGTLGLCAAKWCRQVVGIELSPEAVLDAKANAAENQVENIAFLQGDVGKKLKEIRQENLFPSPDIVMVDPPRVGLGEESIAQILSLDAESIVYVSCNPESQVKDLHQLRSGGYKIQIVQPVDQFPQTVHLETVVLLKKFKKVSS